MAANPLTRKLSRRYAVAHLTQSGWRVTAGPFRDLKAAVAVEPEQPHSVVLLLKGDGASATPVYGHNGVAWQNLSTILGEP